MVKEMNKLLEKLNYKETERIALLNADNDCIPLFSDEISHVKIDREIDPRFPYNFIVIFVRDLSEVETFTPIALHNLMCDGILWFCYPKKSSKKHTSNIDRDYGWKSLNDCGFYGVRMVNVNEEWSALRFRSIKFIKSTSARYPKTD